MDGDFKGKLIRQALRLLRKGLEILERLFGHPPNQSISGDGPALLSEELAPEAEGGGEHVSKAAGLSIREHGLQITPNHRSNRNGQRRLQGAARDVLCRLMIDGHIGVMQVIACQASSGHGTIRDRKRHAEATIAKIKAAIRESGITIQKKKKGWSCYEWILVRDDSKQAESSILMAREIALNAQNSLDGGDCSKAMELAIQALVMDESVQVAHEVLCLAALEIIPADQVNMDRIRASRRVLANRIEQIGRGQQIAENSLPYADDESQRSHLLEAKKDFATEHERVVGILTRLDGHFGPMNVRMSLPDREVHEAIVALRNGGSGLEDVEKQRLQNIVLDHPAVSKIFESIEKKCEKWSSTKRDELRNRARVTVLALCLDPRIPSNIRLVCTKTKQIITSSLRAPTTKCTEARDYKVVEKARDEYYEQHGCRPSVEELVGLTGLSMEQVWAALDWHRINRPLPPEAVDWQKRQRKIEGEENHGQGDDEDDDDPLAGVPA